MFTESIEVVSQISGNFLPLEEQNPLQNQFFHRELALKTDSVTLLDGEKTNSSAQTPATSNKANDSLTGMAYASAISTTSPDLTIDGLSILTVATLGKYLSFSYTIANKGDGYAVSSVTKFYLSKDITWDSSDVYLGMDIVSSLDAKTSKPESASIYFNSNISLNLGTYYLLAQADGYNFLQESNKTNNITAQVLQLSAVPKADLIIPTLSVPSQAALTTQFDLSYTLSNIGNNGATSSYTKFYLSQDNTLDSCDYYLGADVTDVLAAGTTQPKSISVYLNDVLSVGTYYLIAQADATTAVVESNENNNISYQTLNIIESPKPDLLIEALSLPTTVLSGTALGFSYTLNNRGNLQASANYTEFFLSNDATLDNADLYLDSGYVTDISAKTYRTEAFSVNLSNSLTPGTYYIFAASDGYNCVSESEETNNLSYQTLIVTSPDQVYSSRTGYGLVNASAAVAKVLGQNALADVQNIGGKEWDSDLMNVPEVWAQGYTGQGIVVAVLDTGVDRYHRDLSDNIWHNNDEIANNGLDDDGNGYIDDVYGWNFIGKNNNTLDIKGHGTHIAGTIAGVNNNIGVTGVAYNAQIMPVKVLDDKGVGNWTSIAKGIRYAVNNGARVINLSLGGIAGNGELQNAIQYASEQGAIVVMAAGNAGVTTPQYPAAYATHWGLAVGGVDKYKKLASWSNKAGNNAGMDYLTAPGAGIYSTAPNNRYATLNGTSMAASQVAGVVALLLSADNRLTDSQIRQLLTTTAGNNNLSVSLTPTASNTIVPITPQSPSSVSSVQVTSLSLIATSSQDSLTAYPVSPRHLQSEEMSLTGLDFFKA